MNTERETFFTAEHEVSSATADCAVQAWDRTNWRGNNRRADESKLSFVDMGDNDIYNSSRGNCELNNGNRDLQNAENRINRVVNQLLDGDYDTDRLVRELHRSDNSLDSAGREFKDAIKHSGASVSLENLDDMVDGRRDVRDADKKVERAIRQLEAGDENGAIQSLLQSLGEIDSAQKNFRDSRTDNDYPPERDPHDGRRFNHMYPSNNQYSRGWPAFDRLNSYTGDEQSQFQLPDLESALRSGDQISRIADPLGIFPKPSDLSDPNKVIKKVLDPLNIFG